MAKKVDLREELRDYRFEFDFLQKIPCNEQENKLYQNLLENGQELPEGIYRYLHLDYENPTTEFYKIYETDLTESERKEYLAYKQLSFIKTIKKCVLFFTSMAITGIVIYIIMMIIAASIA